MALSSHDLEEDWVTTSIQRSDSASKVQPNEPSVSNIQLLTPQPQTEAPSTAPTFTRFLDLPLELRNCIYKEVFGEYSIIAALNINGCMTIAEAIQQENYDRGEWEYEYDPTRHNKPMTPRYQVKTTPSLLLTSSQVHDEAKTVLQDSTWFTFTITEARIHSADEDAWAQRMLQAEISTFLLWMKHAVVSISALEVDRHWHPVLGEAWLHNWFQRLFDLLDTRAPRLQTLGLEMSLDCIHDPCVIPHSDDFAVQAYCFEPILAAWKSLRFDGVVQLEPVKDGVFFQFTKFDEEPGCSWIARCYPSFWRDFGSECIRVLVLRLR